MCKACSIIHYSLFSYITPNGVRFARKMYIYRNARAREIVNLSKCFTRQPYPEWGEAGA